MGVGATTRFLPVHVLAERLGESLCQVLVAVHTLTGCDYTSKFGTKHAGLNCVPVKFLTNFGTLIGDQSESMANAEEFLVQVLKKGSSCKTLNELRHWLYCHGKNIQLEELPPTSSSATYHILRAFHATYMQVSCLDDKRQLLDMTKFGYSDDDDCFVPTRLLVRTLMRMNSFQAVHVESVRGGHACVLRPAYHAASTANVEVLPT